MEGMNPQHRMSSGAAYPHRLPRPRGGARLLSLRACFLAFALTLLAVPGFGQESAPAAGASPWRLTVDPAASSVTFLLDATMHEVHGTFAVRSGELRFHPASGRLEGEVVVDAKSADTGSEGRDEEMHEKVLESGKYPTLTFVPKAFQGTLQPRGESRGTLEGEMRIHGSTHKVSLPTRVTLEGDRFTAHSTLTVPYVEWGLKDPSKFVFRVAKEVEVEIEAKGTVARP